MAEVEIHGDQGDLRTLSGRPARWRQQLVRDPNSTGGVAVIRIEDQQGSREGYTGAIRWRGGSNNWGGVGNWATGGYLDDRWDQKITQSAAMNICRIQVVATGNGSRSKVRVQPGSQSADCDYTFNVSFANKMGKTKNGFCSVSRSGQILQFQVEQANQGGRVSLNQALDTCQGETARHFGVSGNDDVRVQHGADPGNSSYLINHQARQKNGKITTGACRVSPIGENEAFQWW